MKGVDFKSQYTLMLGFWVENVWIEISLSYRQYEILFVPVITTVKIMNIVYQVRAEGVVNTN